MTSADKGVAPNYSDEERRDAATSLRARYPSRQFMTAPPVSWPTFLSVHRISTGSARRTIARKEDLRDG